MALRKVLFRRKVKSNEGGILGGGFSVMFGFSGLSYEESNHRLVIPVEPLFVPKRQPKDKQGLPRYGEGGMPWFGGPSKDNHKKYILRSGCSKDQACRESNGNLPLG